MSVNKKEILVSYRGQNISVRYGDFHFEGRLRPDKGEGHWDIQRFIPGQKIRTNLAHVVARDPIDATIQILQFADSYKPVTKKLYGVGK